MQTFPLLKKNTQLRPFVTHKMTFPALKRYWENFISLYICPGASAADANVEKFLPAHKYCVSQVFWLLFSCLLAHNWLQQNDAMTLLWPTDALHALKIKNFAGTLYYQQITCILPPIFFNFAPECF